ncbi:uncharacterized protein N7518_003667 [Penicillium psychrosexuale]|uniref:uncharacterized protein n=1 Tax=Penicillium psychrosexuale TaxID=1002107 RepID=UPI002544DC81|nr:uncharacterized protein N7518_003667 [Penicillium psychrosexuale]KAJ5801599.1 hypothetical protein N7518_003667 [Penicillium psychrosexuale]
MEPSQTLQEPQAEARDLQQTRLFIGKTRYAPPHSPPRSESLKSSRQLSEEWEPGATGPENIPDVIGLQDTNGTTKLKLIGELKIPWVDEDPLVSTAKQSELRRTIAQPLRDMQIGVDHPEQLYSRILNAVSRMPARNTYTPFLSTGGLLPT